MFGDDFYPTPRALASDMLAKLDISTVERILEPSAGRGDLVEAIESKYSSRGGRQAKVDVIESDTDLVAVLKAKGMTVVGRDFLTFETFATYDAIVMNPPFSAGAKHLIKALEVIRSGGDVVCLLNAETLRNPYTAERKALLAKLDALDAVIEYRSGEFSSADRKTNVEVALVHVHRERQPQSDILANLVQAKEMMERDYQTHDVVDGDPLRGAVRRYEVEAAAGLKLIDEYNALKPILTHELTGDRKRPILELTAGGDHYDDRNIAHKFVESLRMKYWREIFSTGEFTRMFTSKTREKYRESVAELARYEFNLTNIKQIQSDLAQSMLDNLDESIIQLFDGFCDQYWDEASKNIHYYNGWKTNKAYSVNRKVITRLNAYGWTDNFDPRYNVNEQLGDIAKVFAYLDGKVYDNAPLTAALATAKEQQQTRDVDLEYFTATFYKKGTTHIVFKDDRLLKKFNLIGSQRKGWLPPNYGKTTYADMSQEERAVVDAVEGEDSYMETVESFDFYLGDKSATLPLIGSGL